MAAYKTRGGAASAELIERVRARNHAKAAVRRALAHGPATPPQVAEAAGLPRRDAFWILMALRRYGVVVDDGEEDGYVRYALSGKDPRA
jgi:hypothetical protein